jgi:hypothetical protein
MKMKTFKGLMEIIAKDVKDDLKYMNPEAFSKKHGKTKNELKGFEEDANMTLDAQINEVLSKDASAGEYIHDFVHSDNPKFAGKSKEQRKKQALAAYYAQKNEEVVTEGKDPADDASQEAYGFQRGVVKKNKDGSHVATSHSGSRKIFKSEMAAKAHANSGKEDVVDEGFERSSAEYLKQHKAEMEKHKQDQKAKKERMDMNLKNYQAGKVRASDIKEAKEKTEYDYEGDMARGQLQSIINNAQKVHDMLEDNDNLPEWVQSKITLSEDYISTVANYMMSELDEAMSGGNYASFHKETGKIGYIGNKRDMINHVKSNSDHTRGYTGPNNKVGDIFGGYPKKTVKEETGQIEEGRPSQQPPLEGHPYHKKTNAELEYISKDARAAGEAMKSHGTASGRAAENKYADQANDSATVRHFRKTSGMPSWYKKKYDLNESEVSESNGYKQKGDVNHGSASIKAPGTGEKLSFLNKMYPNKKKQPNGAEFAAQRRVNRIADSGHMEIGRASCRERV